MSSITNSASSVKWYTVLDFTARWTEAGLASLGLTPDSPNVTTALPEHTTSRIVSYNFWHMGKLIAANVTLNWLASNGHTTDSPGVERVVTETLPEGTLRATLCPFGTFNVPRAELEGALDLGFAIVKEDQGDGFTQVSAQGMTFDAIASIDSGLRWLEWLAKDGTFMSFMNDKDLTSEWSQASEHERREYRRIWKQYRRDPRILIRKRINLYGDFAPRLIDFVNHTKTQLRLGSKVMSWTKDENDRSIQKQVQATFDTPYPEFFAEATGGQVIMPIGTYYTRRIEHKWFSEGENRWRTRVTTARFSQPYKGSSLPAGYRPTVVALAKAGTPDLSTVEDIQNAGFCPGEQMEIDSKSQSRWLGTPDFLPAAKKSPRPMQYTSMKWYTCPRCKGKRANCKLCHGDQGWYGDPVTQAIEITREQGDEWAKIRIPEDPNAIELEPWKPIYLYQWQRNEEDGKFETKDANQVKLWSTVLQVAEAYERVGTESIEGEATNTAAWELDDEASISDDDSEIADEEDTELDTSDEPEPEPIQYNGLRSPWVEEFDHDAGRIVTREWMPHELAMSELLEADDRCKSLLMQHASKTVTPKRNQWHVLVTPRLRDIVLTARKEAVIRIGVLASIDRAERVDEITRRANAAWEAMTQMGMTPTDQAQQTFHEQREPVAMLLTN